MKLHLRRLPIIGYEPYDDSNTELALVIQLYDAQYLGHFEGQTEMIDESYIKGSIAAARSLTLNTDVIDRKIPIFFFMENPVADEYLTTFLDAGIRRDRIRTFHVPNSPLTKYRVSKGFYMLNDEVIREYECYVKWDADLFACCDPSLGQKLSTHWLQGHELAALHFSRNSDVGIIRKPDKIHWFDKWDGNRDTFDENFERTRSELAKVDIDIEIDGLYHNVLCGLMRFPKPSKLPDGFHDFVMRAEPACGDEELIMSLWVKHANSWLRSLDPQPMCWDGDKISEFRGQGAYFLHTRSYSETEEDWEPLFQQDIGAIETKSELVIKPSGNSIVPQIRVLNLDRRTDRLNSFKNALQESGYLAEPVRIAAIDKQNYATRERLLQDAATEYEGFAGLMGTSDKQRPWDAHQWSYLRCLKAIADQDEYVLLMEDDMVFAKLWPETLALLQELPSDFKIALLNYNHDHKRHNKILRYNDNWYIGAKSNGTTATCFSPQGARELHDFVCEHIDISAEMHVRRNQLPDVYSAVTVMAWTNEDAGDSDLTPHHNIPDNKDEVVPEQDEASTNKNYSESDINRILNFFNGQNE